LFSNIAPCCAACTFVCYISSNASTYYNTKNQVLKKAETEGNKKALLGAGLVLVGLILSVFANFGSSQRNDIE
jgi:hypothetical protein